MLVARSNCRAFLGKQRIGVRCELEERGRNQQINIEDNVSKEGGRKGENRWEKRIHLGGKYSQFLGYGEENANKVQSLPAAHPVLLFISLTHTNSHTLLSSHIML